PRPGRHQPVAQFPDLSIPLDGTTSDYPVFNTERPRASSSYRIDYTYHLIAGRELGKIPVWITPAIAPRSDQHVLELQIQWVDADGPFTHLELESVESLELKVPVEWGNPVNANKAIISSPRAGHEGNGERGSQTLRLIQWAQLRPSQEESRRKRL